MYEDSFYRMEFFAIRDRTKSIMGRYAEKIDSYFSKRGVDVYGNKPISRRVYMGNNNG